MAEEKVGVDAAAERPSVGGGGEPATSSVAQLLARVRGSRSAAIEPTRAADVADLPWDLDRLTAAIVERAERLLPGTVMEADTDLFEAGASSVAAVEFLAVLARELNVRLSLDDVFADARPRRLARLWLAATGVPVGTASDLDTVGPADTVDAGVRLPARVLSREPDDDLEWIMADLARADRLPWVGRPEPVAPRRILVTGVTGFLGSHLLMDLLRHSDADAVCVVRGEDDEAAERRLGEALKSYSVPWSAEVRRRVTVVAGDIGRPRLGLTEERWEHLAREVDSIVNVAAAVDFLRGYPSLRQTNVLGPLHLAEFAMTGRLKPVHQISSTGVFNELGTTSMGEDDPLAHVDRLHTGYEKSKWAAEGVLRRAREHGLVVTFLRPSAIAGHTRTGAYNPQDLSVGFAAASNRFRTMPAFRVLNSAPVDWISRVAAAIVVEPSAWDRNYHLTGVPTTLEDTMHDLRLSGMNTRVLGWDEWRADFLTRMAADPVPELEFLVRVLHNPGAVKLCEANLYAPLATAKRTDALVARLGLPKPKRVDAQAQMKNFERLADDGYVRLPHRDDPPYLWFSETLSGTVGPIDGPVDTPLSASLTLSVASMYQVVRERRIDVSGEVVSPLLHELPLTVEHGEMFIRPDDGVPLRHGLRHPLLRYQLRLRDSDGGAWWLVGQKTARLHRDVRAQVFTLAVEIGREGEPVSITGVAEVPRGTYLREQVDGLQAHPGLSMQEQRTAKATWMAWFAAQIVRGLATPALRAGAELLDLRRGARRKELD